jgi:hypothetical protein
MKWFKRMAEEGRQQIEKGVADKLMEEELNPTLRDSKDQPLKAIEKKQKNKGGDKE